MFENSSFVTSDQTTIQTYISNQEHKEWIIVTHGLGEHALRHEYLFELFSNHYNICLYDLRGHGLSEGKRGDIGAFLDYVIDLNEMVCHLKKTYGMEAYSLLGHSMGGLIVATYIKYITDEDYVQRVFLSSPAVGGGGAGKLLGLLSQGALDFLASLPLNFRVKGMLELKKLSHDKDIYKKYIEDKNNTLAISLHLFLQILSQAKSTFSTSLELQSKTFVSIGTADVLVDPKKCINYFRHVEMSELLVVKDGYHELHNETAEYKKQYIEFLKNAFIG